jgi:hypothetical protein
MYLVCHNCQVVTLVLLFGCFYDELKGSNAGDKRPGPYDYSGHHDRGSHGLYPGNQNKAWLNALPGGISEGREDSFRGLRIEALDNRFAVAVADGLLFHNRFHSLDN